MYKVSNQAGIINLAIIFLALFVIGCVTDVSGMSLISKVIFLIAVIAIICGGIVLFLGKVEFKFARQSNNEVEKQITCTVINNSHKLVEFSNIDLCLRPGDTRDDSGLLKCNIVIDESESVEKICEHKDGNYRWSPEGIIIETKHDKNNIIITINSDPCDTLEITYTGKRILGLLNGNYEVSYITGKCIEVTGQYQNIITPNNKYIAFSTKNGGLTDGFRWTCTRIAFNKSTLNITDIIQ